MECVIEVILFGFRYHLSRVLNNLHCNNDYGYAIITLVIHRWLNNKNISNLLFYNYTNNRININVFIKIGNKYYSGNRNCKVRDFSSFTEINEEILICMLNDPYLYWHKSFNRIQLSEISKVSKINLNDVLK